MSETTEETPEETGYPVEAVEEQAPSGPALMGIAAPNRFQESQPIPENAPVVSPIANHADILQVMSEAHGEAMEVLNRIWDHLTNRM